MMINPEPLKDKVNIGLITTPKNKEGEYRISYNDEDVEAAVEWLINNLYSVMEQEDEGVTLYFNDLKKIINKAFPDLLGEKADGK